MNADVWSVNLHFLVRPILAGDSEAKVVSLEWIHKSAASKKKVPETEYLMHLPDEEEDEEIKAEDDENDVQVTSKKRGRTTKSKGSKIKKEDNEADEEPPAKKAKGQGGGQYWKRGMVIPVDEECDTGCECRRNIEKTQTHPIQRRGRST